MKFSGFAPKKIKPRFSALLASYKKATIDTDTLILKLEQLLSEENQLDAKCQQELKKIIDSAHLSQQLKDVLIKKIVEDKTVLVQLDAPANLKKDNSERHRTYSSSLLKKLLQCNDRQREKTIQAGQIIRNSYCLESIIGSGGMGTVWKALDLIQDAGEAKDRHVAIKFVDQTIKSHPDALKALVREFARYKKLIHPNIVKAYELNHDENEIFIVMEYLQGMSLKEFIKRHPEGVPLDLARPIIKGMCEALEYAHNEGIIHLDFKPSNVFYNPKTKCCKVIDFGIARVSSAEERDKTRFDPGKLGAITTAYASPEMLMEAEPDRRDDIYGLACVIYELLAGEHPFKRDKSIKAEREKIKPRQIPALNKKQFMALEHGLNFQRQHRTPTAQAFYSELFLIENQQGKDKNKQFIYGFIGAVAILTIPYLIYNGYKNWANQQIVNQIQQQLKTGVDQFQALPVDEQNELLLNEPDLPLAIAKYAAKQNDALAEINQYDASIQQALLTKKTVSDYLIDVYVNKIEQAVADDQFQIAKQLSEQILHVYPDSLRLVKQFQQINPQKKIRLAALYSQYQQCLADETKNLAELFPCIQQTRTLTEKIDPDSEWLSSPALQQRFEQELKTAINSQNFSLADSLITDWQTIDHQNNVVRFQLAQASAYGKQLQRLKEQIQNSHDQELANILTFFPTQSVKLQQDVLASHTVRQQVLRFYQQTAKKLLDQQAFADAEQRLSIGLDLINGYKKETVKLQQLVKTIKQKKQSFIAALEKSLKKQFAKMEPDVSQIQSIHNQIQEVAPHNAVLNYPGLKDNYTKKVNMAIAEQNFELAKRLMRDWITLKEADANSMQFIRLLKKNDAARAADHRKKQIAQQLQRAIDQGQLTPVNQILAQSAKQLTDVDQQLILKRHKNQLISFFQKQIELALAKDDIDAARVLTTSMQNLYPKQQQAVNVANNKIAREIAKQINPLLVGYQQTLNLERVDAEAIFLPLLKITSFDKQYLNKHVDQLEKLKNKLLERVDQRTALPQIQAVMTAWADFLEKNPQFSEKNQAIYRKTRNLIALRCLFKGRKLNSQKRLTEANAFFMLGFSLEPANKIKSALEKELM